VLGVIIASFTLLRWNTGTDLWVVANAAMAIVTLDGLWTMAAHTLKK